MVYVKKKLNIVWTKTPTLKYNDINIKKAGVFMEKIRAEKMRLVDEYGRERIFNGVNICDKGYWRRDYGKIWQKGLAEKLNQSGINLIRLGMNWDAIEPKMGEYNEDFLNGIGEILDECEQAGVYVYLDMHQDLYSFFETADGDGAPLWACMTEGHQYKKVHFVWAEGYFLSKAVHKSFDNFWANSELHGRGVQDRFFDMWSYVIKKFGEHKAVIGFDILNEPFPGTDGGKVIRKILTNLVKTTIFDKSISLKELVKRALKPETRHEVLDLYGGPQLRRATSAADELIKKFDTTSYSHFINKAAKTIRELGSDKIIVMENSYYSNLGIPYSCPIPSVDGNADENVVFAPHAYDFMVDTPEYKYANNARIKAIFDEHKRSQERLGVPVIVGEWGGYTEGNEWFHHIKFLEELFDSYKWSSTYWLNFDGSHDWSDLDSTFKSELITDVLMRPHPIAVTGEIKSFRHDRENSSFMLEYAQEKEYTVPTEIYLPSKPSQIQTDGEYTLENIDGCEAVILKLKTDAGEHEIKVSL